MNALSSTLRLLRLGRVALLAGALVATACGDLLQEPDTGFSKITLHLEEVSGNGQTGEPGSPLAEPMRVRLVGAGDEPIPRLRIEWLVMGGSGTANPRNTFSDEAGLTETTWTLGPESGPQTLRAQVREGVFVDFQATAVSP